MAREIIVKLWCDLCLAEGGSKVEGEEIPPLALDPRGKPRILTLCPVHRKEIYEPLRDALTELGQIVHDGDVKPLKVPGRSHGGSRAQGGPFPCPVEGCDYPGAPSKGALQKHARGAHEATLAELEKQAREEEAGHDPELDLHEELKLTCPECGDLFVTARGMGAHRAKRHGVKGTSKDAKRRHAKDHEADGE